MKIKFLENRVIYIIVFLLLWPMSTFCQTDREEWQPPGKIMDAIGVKEGMVIGEAGAGGGWFTFYLAERVGDKGKIYANDISESSLMTLRNRAEREGVENIMTVLGEVEDPIFPERNLDMIIMVYVLHMLDRPLEFMENLKKYLKPDGQLVIIELNTSKDRGHAPSFMSRKQIIDTIQGTNYDLERKETFLPRDTIYILRVKDKFQ
jgi:ubiquinone/menaquinone biosynthesis C-methylase UbiE